ncbi:unnamed protein product [Acidithrix sp. C25]|nr:unnamed protein product [Acidithrix sp. C25]
MGDLLPRFDGSTHELAKFGEESERLSERLGRNGQIGRS